MFSVLSWAAVCVLGATGRKVLDAGTCVEGAAGLARTIQESPVQGNVTVCLDSSQRYVPGTLRCCMQPASVCHAAVRHSCITSFQADSISKQHKTFNMYSHFAYVACLVSHDAYRVCNMFVMSRPYLLSHVAPACGLSTALRELSGLKVHSGVLTSLCPRLRPVFAPMQWFTVRKCVW